MHLRADGRIRQGRQIEPRSGREAVRVGGYGSESLIRGVIFGSKAHKTRLSEAGLDHLVDIINVD